MTQEELGEALGLDKTQVSKIERGRRRLDIGEVAAAAVFLRTTTRDLLGMPERSKLALATRLATDAPRDSLRKLQNRARQIVEIDDVLAEVVGLSPGRANEGVEEIRAKGSELAHRRQVSGVALRRQGQELAEEARKVLDLGSDALGDLPDLVETYFGVDVALSPMGEGADGLCVHGDDVRLIVANSDFTPGHVRFTLAHELGHHLFGDPRAIIGEDHQAMFTKEPTEQRANAFAANFLMPEKGIRTTLRSLDEGARVSQSAVVQLMLHFGVSLMAITYRLQNLELLTDEKGNALRGMPVAKLIEAHADKKTADVATQDLGIVRPPTRLHRAAREAFVSRKLGLGPLAALLERPDDDALFTELLESEDVTSAFAENAAAEQFVV